MLTRPEIKGKRLRAVQPNIGIEIEYRHQLQALIESMAHSVRYWLESAYRRNPPVLAQDSAASVIKDVFKGVARRWRKAWNDVVETLARYFARQVQVRTDAALQRTLRDAGLHIDAFTTTDAMRDVLHATIEQNVSLIKSIPQKYLSEVEQAVMRSVQMGGDLEGLTEELEKKFGVAHKRAAFIAKSQNAMATASMTRVRQIEMSDKFGTRVVWNYTWRSKEPRPVHVKFHGREFDPRRGLWDSHELKMVIPGQLPNCQCLSKIII